MKTCIIIPTLRERENIARLIPAIFTQCPEVTVLVVDDNSQDGTEEATRQFPHVELMVRTQDHGYGASILDGFRWALKHGYDQVITMDADFSHDPHELPALIAKLDGFDVVIGSRYVAGGGIANWHWQRRVLSRFANLYVRFILRTGIADNTTGFTAYRRTALEALMDNRLAADGYAFLVETKYVLKNLHIYEHPITYTERREGQSKMSARNIWESIWLPWRLRFARLKR